MKKLMSLLVFLAFSWLLSCGSKEKKEEKEHVKYVATSPIVIDTSFTKEYVSQIRSIRNIEIRAQEKGFLQTIFVEEGQFVQAGQLLFRIMPKFYEAELLKAKAEESIAEIEFKNTKALADKNVVSKNEQAMAQAKLEQLKAQVALANLHLSFTEIRAPFSGTIDRIPKKMGSLIGEGELLTTLSDNSKIVAYFNVSEIEYLEYQTNIAGRGSADVTLRLANNMLFKNKGKVDVIESEFNNETGNIAFRASFLNSNKLLKNGETGKVVMKIPVRNALIVPQKATYELQDKKFVFVIDKDNTVKSREITVTGELPDLYVIHSGLNVTDKILLEGVQKVSDGNKIDYSYEKPQNVIYNLKLKSE